MYVTISGQSLHLENVVEKKWNLNVMRYFYSKIQRVKQDQLQLPTYTKYAYRWLITPV